MSVKVIVKTDAKIFNRAELERTVSRVVVQTAKDFKQSTKDAMINSPHTGRVYNRRRGEGFSRSHQASRRGERPSPDSGNLVNAIVDKKVGQFSVSVEIDEAIAPYGVILQNKKLRKIMTEDDARIAQIVFAERCNKAILELIV